MDNVTLLVPAEEAFSLCYNIADKIPDSLVILRQKRTVLILKKVRNQYGIFNP